MTINYLLLQVQKAIKQSKEMISYKYMLSIYHGQLPCFPSASHCAAAAMCIYNCKLSAAHRDVSTAHMQ